MGNKNWNWDSWQFYLKTLFDLVWWCLRVEWSLAENWLDLESCIVHQLCQNLMNSPYPESHILQHSWSITEQHDLSSSTLVMKTRCLMKNRVLSDILTSRGNGRVYHVPLIVNLSSIHLIVILGSWPVICKQPCLWVDPTRNILQTQIVLENANGSDRWAPVYLVWQVLDIPAAEWTKCDVSHSTAKSGVLLQITNKAGFEKRCCSAQGSLKLRLMPFCQLCWLAEYSTRGTDGRFLHIKLLQKAFCFKEDYP